MLSKKASEELPLIPQWMLNKSPGADAAGGNKPLPSPTVGPSHHERPWVADRWNTAPDKDIAEGTKGIDKWGQEERRWKEDERGDARPQLVTVGGARRDAGARWGKPAAFENGWPPGEAPARDGFAADRWSALETTPTAREPVVKERWRDDRWGSAAKPTPEQRTWGTGGEGMEQRSELRDARIVAPEARTPVESSLPRQESGRWRSPGETRGEERTTPLVLPGKHRGFGFGRGRGLGGGNFAPGAGGGDGWERGGGCEAPGGSALSSAFRQAAPKRHGQQYTMVHLQDICDMMQFKLRSDLPLPRGLKAPDLGPLLKGTPDEDEHEPEPAAPAAAAAEVPPAAAAAASAAGGAGPAGQSAGFGSRFIPPSTDVAFEQQGQAQGQALSMGSDAAAVLPQDLASALQQLSGLGIGAPAQQQQQQQQQQPLQAPAPLQIPDAWVYQDPQGNVQGPFTKADIMEWLEAGYFSLNLPIKPATESADRGWVPLHAMLQAWQSHHPAPPGFASSMQPPQQQLVGAASMHSHPSGSLPDAAGAVLAGHGSIGLDPAQQQALGSAASLGHGPHGMPHSLLGDPLALMQQQQQQQQQIGGLGGMGQPQPLMQHQMHPGGPGGMGLGLGQPFASTTMGMPVSQQHAPWGPPPQQMLRPPQLPAHMMPQLPPGSSGFGGGAFDPHGPSQQQQQQPYTQAPSSLQQQHLAQQHAQQQQMAMQQQAAQQQQAELERQQQAQQQQQRPPERNVLDLIFPNHAGAAQQQQQQPPPAAAGAAASPWGKAPEPALPATQDEAAARPRLFARGAQQQPAAAAAAPQKPQQEQQAESSGWEVVGARPHKAPHTDEPPASTPPQQARKTPAHSEQQQQLSSADSGSLGVPSGPMTVPLLPTRQQEPPKVAPWAATTQAAPGGGGKNLRQIQEEEQARAAAEAARQRAAVEAAAAAAAAAPAVAPVGPWGRVGSGAAASGAAPPGQWGSAAPIAAPAAVAPPLRDILSEEQQRVAAVPRTASLEPRPSGKKAATLGDVIALKLEGPAAASGSSGSIAWAAAGARSGGVSSLKQVMMEETMADLEGGAMDEDGIEELLFPLQQRHLQQQQAAQQREREQQQREQQAAAAAELRAKVERERSRIAEQAAPRQQQREDEGLFWDYGGPPAAAPQAAPAPARSAAPAPQRPAQANGGGWAARVAVNTPAAASRATHAAPAPQQQRAAPSRPAYAAAAAPMAAAAAAPAAAAPVPRGGSGLFMGSLELSQDFAVWCRSQMLAFNGNDDLTLIEFLWGIDSNSEVAEYCQELWGNRPGVSGFVADFIKRKAAEQKGSSGRRKKKPAAAAPAAAAPAPSAGISSAAVGMAATGPGSDAWSKIPKKPAAKKKSGKKLDASELGFTSKLPIALLENDD